MGKFNRILLHVAGCVSFLALPIIFSPDAGNLSDLWKYAPATKDFLVYLALLLFFYFNYFWLIPNFYFKRKYGGFFLIAFLCFTGIVILPSLLSTFSDSPPHERYQWPANNPMPVAQELPPPEEHPERPHEPLHRSLLLDVSHRLFLFLAVFFFPLILRIRDR